MSIRNEKELLIEIVSKVDNLTDKVHSIDITVAKQEINLDEHMRRTVANENRLEIFEEKIAPALDSYKFIATCVKWSVPIFTIMGVWYKYFKE